MLKKNGELDFAFSVEGFSRVRANVFRQRGSYAAALRILSYDVPTPQQLGIPQSVVNLTTKMRGLVLVTGATGSGKSTTLASLIDVIASRDSKNIITLEDPTLKAPLYSGTARGWKGYTLICCSPKSCTATGSGCNTCRRDARS